MDRDRELQQLYDQVARLFGIDACAAANQRAYDRVASAKDRDPEEWLLLFNEAWKVELRQLLRPH